MSYRNDVDALEARKTALEFEVEQKKRERDLAAMLLHEAKARAKLPILDNIRVATPCTADWNDMVGDERIRHCMKCDKDVFNLSQMTREDAEQLLQAKQGKLCARYYQRADGTILTSDCAVGKKQKRRRRVMAVAAAALVAGGGAFTWKLMTHTDPAPRERENVILGGMSGPNMTMGDIGPSEPSPPLPHEEHVVEALGGVAMDPEPQQPPHVQRVRKQPVHAQPVRTK